MGVFQGDFPRELLIDNNLLDKFKFGIQNAEFGISVRASRVKFQFAGSGRVVKL